MDVILLTTEGIPEEEFEEEIHVAITLCNRLADCSQMLYIYIRKLNFLGSLFWRGFGEVLERFWREILESKSIKSTVFYKVF